MLIKPCTICQLCERLCFVSWNSRKMGEKTLDTYKRFKAAHSTRYKTTVTTQPALKIKQCPIRNITIFYYTFYVILFRYFRYLCVSADCRHALNSFPLFLSQINSLCCFFLSFGSCVCLYPYWKTPVARAFGWIVVHKAKPPHCGVINETLSWMGALFRVGLRLKLEVFSRFNSISSFYRFYMLSQLFLNCGKNFDVKNNGKSSCRTVFDIWQCVNIQS